MAAPYIAGLVASLNQYLAADSKYRDITGQDRTDLAAQLMMSTAVPVKYGDTDAYYSPRQQGAGLANIAAAEKTDVYLTVDSAHEKRPKAELGESVAGTWSFDVTLHNVGASPQSYTPDTAALSDKIADGKFAQVPVNYTGKGKIGRAHV